MKINIEQMENVDDLEITIKCNNIDEKVQKILSFLKTQDIKINGIKDDKIYLINYKNIYYIESVENKTFIYCEKEVYESKLKLYEFEEKLSSYNFFRCSKSFIVNLKYIKALVPLFNSRIEIELKNGEKLVVNRQYIKLLKERLNIK